MLSLVSRDYAIPKIGVIADDLTGACDSGVEFLRCSESVVVIVEAGSPTATGSQEGVLVYNTQSRKLSPREAYERAFTATQRVLSAGDHLIFKKVDSALRGNFGVEIGAVMDATGATAAFLLPAIPEAGRETVGGIQHIDGVPIAESFYAHDPEHPVSESSVLRRAVEGTSRKAGLIPLEDVRFGKAAQTAERLTAQGCQLLVVDARSAKDLCGAVHALVPLGHPKVFVGCQGLARALSECFGVEEGTAQVFEESRRPILFVCGSVHPRAKRQLAQSAASNLLELVEIPTGFIIDQAPLGSALNEFAEGCHRRLREGRNVAVCIRGELTDVPPGFCDSALAFLSNLTLRVLERVRPAALVLTGGETAYAVCRALGIHSLKLHSAIAPLVVASKVVGGPYHDLTVLTKGGSIGPDDLMSRILNFLRSNE